VRVGSRRSRRVGKVGVRSCVRVQRGRGDRAVSGQRGVEVGGSRLDGTRIRFLLASEVAHGIGWGGGGNLSARMYRAVELRWRGDLKQYGRVVPERTKAKAPNVSRVHAPVEDEINIKRHAMSLRRRRGASSFGTNSTSNGGELWSSFGCALPAGSECTLWTIGEY